MPMSKEERAEYSRNRYATFKAIGMAPRVRTPDYLLRKLVARYGLTIDSYMALYQAQCGKCRLCGTPISLPASGAPRADLAHVDHCHTTGKVRGMLCAGCNRGLGFFKENPAALRNAAAYLE